MTKQNDRDGQPTLWNNSNLKTVNRGKWSNEHQIGQYNLSTSKYSTWQTPRDQDNTIPFSGFATDRPLESEKDSNITFGLNESMSMNQKEKKTGKQEYH